MQDSALRLRKEPSFTQETVERVTELVGAELGTFQPCRMAPCNQLPMERCSGDLQARGAAEHLADLPHGGGHWTRDIQFTSDGKKMFVSVGSSSNVDDPDTTPGGKESRRHPGV